MIALKKGKEIARKSNIVLDKSGITNPPIMKKNTVAVRDKNGLEILVNGAESNGNAIEEDKHERSSNGSPEGVKGRLSLLKDEDVVLQKEVLDKDEILEQLSTIFYQTQVLSNNSKLSKEIASMDANFKRIKDLCATSDKQAEDPSKSSQTVDEISKEVSDLRSKWKFVIDSYEKVRESLYPVAEKIALIELQKNPYRIPGDPYKKIQVVTTDVSQM